MTHNEEQYLQQKMDTANLKELFPEFDKEAEWKALSGKMKSRSVPDYKWMRMAAMLLLVVSVGGYLVFLNNTTSTQNNVVASSANPLPDTIVKQAASEMDGGVKSAAEPRQIASVSSPTKVKRATFLSSRPVQAISAMALATATYGKSTEAICNATKCAIEICISQTVKCKDKAPAAVADCRTLEPDQAGPLKYTDPERYGCTVTVDEIRIKKVATGETIVINSETQPASAEEMLQCFTGEKKCDMMAGFFDTDCNDNNSPRKITIDSHYGDVIIQ